MSTRLIIAALAVLGFLASPLAAQEGSRLQKILESGTLRVGTTGDFNPMSFKDPGSNEYQGFDIDVAKQFAADMEVEIEFVPTDWKTLVNGVVADKYDLTTSASLSMARAKVAGYSDAYVEFGTVPMTLKANVEKFDGWDSINNGDTAVAVTLGTVFEAQARDYFPNAQIVSVEAPARDYQEVLAGRAMVSITSNVEAASLIKTYPELTVIPVDEARSRRPGAFLLDQGDQIWINYVNHWIDLKTTEGYFDQLALKWGLQ
ncbi:MAG: transporter substrate-binding domain-containing protein [Alphaproteobacteria bacterium]